MLRALVLLIIIVIIIVILIGIESPSITITITMRSNRVDAVQREGGTPMKPMIGISAMALLAAGGWAVGGRARPPSPAASLEPAVLREGPSGRGDRAQEGGVRLAAA